MKSCSNQTQMWSDRKYKTVIVVLFYPWKDTNLFLNESFQVNFSLRHDVEEIGKFAALHLIKLG